MSKFLCVREVASIGSIEVVLGWRNSLNDSLGCLSLPNIICCKVLQVCNHLQVAHYHA